MFAFVVVLLTGLLVTNLIGRQLVGTGEDLLKRIPLVRIGLRRGEELRRERAVPVNSFRRRGHGGVPAPGVWSIGFLTAEDVPEVSARPARAARCVYMSAAPNPTAGFIVIVPRRQLVELDMSVDAAMKMIITCGVVVPPLSGEGAHPVLEKPAA